LAASELHGVTAPKTILLTDIMFCTNVPF
jgi:hypothetical protein